MNNLQDGEFTMEVDVLLAEGNEVRLHCLFSPDWPRGFIHAAVAEAQGWPINEFVKSYQTPRGRIDCTRAIMVSVRPVGLPKWTEIQLPILETKQLPMLEARQLPIAETAQLPIPISLIMGRPQVRYFMPPHRSYTPALQPLVRLDLSPRHSYTPPGALATYEPMAAGLNGFHNFTPPPPAYPLPSAYMPGPQLQVTDFPQVGHSTFASAATADEPFRGERIRMWVENNFDNDNNAPSEDAVDG